MLKACSCIGLLLISTSVMAGPATVQLRCNDLINNPQINHGKSYNVSVDEAKHQVTVGKQVFSADIGKQAVVWKTGSPGGTVSLSRVDLSYIRYGQYKLRNGEFKYDHASTGCEITGVSAPNTIVNAF
ncbi:hypothetical protein LMG33818_001815 [Halomonadaceae bacterium LMG 33818]|uniref:hypothetical protein n=1 Tax=Cernens ardua TaxID=3402176 RepID=UPI003EDC5224